MNSLASVYIDIEITTIEEEIIYQPVKSKAGHWEGSHYITGNHRGQWSKWGGARKFIQQKVNNGEWHCQSCGKLQAKQLTPYTTEIMPKEFIHVCAICYSDDCAKYRRRMKFA